MKKITVDMDAYTAAFSLVPPSKELMSLFTLNLGDIGEDGIAIILKPEELSQGIIRIVSCSELLLKE